ncbi:MAG: ribonuclease III [Deltaproteobacteria bacterium]|nr:ribonuclease III [Deltaproteobacteria bacterium]
MSELASFEAILRYSFQRKELLSLALTHRSSHLRPGEDHNEKLEFLGDSVLGLAMSDLLMRRFPQASEGDLSKMRASLVNAGVLATKAAALSLGQWLRLGGGEERSGGRKKPSILASAYEAVLGAVYLDGGFTPAYELVSRHFADELEEKSRAVLFDGKTRLQEISQKIFREIPVYTVVEAKGPDHQRLFISQVSIAGKLYGRGEGSSKKSADQAAAFQTLATLQLESEEQDKTEP